MKLRVLNQRLQQTGTWAIETNFCLRDVTVPSSGSIEILIGISGAEQ